MSFLARGSTGQIDVVKLETTRLSNKKLDQSPAEALSSTHASNDYTFNDTCITRQCWEYIQRPHTYDLLSVLFTHNSENVTRRQYTLHHHQTKRCVHLLYTSFEFNK